MVNYLPPLIGVIGKTNVGKSTFFSAATMTTVEISNRPFTTIKPNHGIGYVKITCPHLDFGLEACNPRTGYCQNGNRFVPIELLDVAGLIPGAHMGRGLGNKFMDDLRKADAFILVIDASGSTNEEGNPVPPGTYDPIEEVKQIINEVDLWLAKIVSSDWQKFSVSVETSRKNFVDALYDKISGLSIKRSHVIEVLERIDLTNKRPSNWKEEDFYIFAKELRKTAKPHIIAANKADLPTAYENIERLKKEFPEVPVVPVSSESELALRKAAKMNLIDYIPGDSIFFIKENVKLTPQQEVALKYIEEKVLKRYGSTGVQKVINSIIYDVLKKVVVFPVEDINKLTDKNGNILPDALIVDHEASPKVVAGLIHTELEKGFQYAIDAKTKQKMGEGSRVYDRLVFKIVSTI
ncbi:redox-regulated ATPase YchF [Fervidicoccus fontis]|uniref:Redox-regulated ATPase YchF n=1 Tax=Fervidicoccus fontis TaxID=683846 RepID=A0A843AAF8_9CREN|nr:redox-regulated ATPase YchF [Fervidicoccus fontis]MBE9391044.1 redox-regulated ATPase YchF [Fervidicoccus fontis]